MAVDRRKMDREEWLKRLVRLEDDINSKNELHWMDLRKILAKYDVILEVGKKQRAPKDTKVEASKSVAIDVNNNEKLTQTTRSGEKTRRKAISQMFMEI